MVFEKVSELVLEPCSVCAASRSFFSKYDLEGGNKYFKGENSSIEDITLQSNIFTKNLKLVADIFDFG